MISLPEMELKIRQSENFSFIKLGDGEIICMEGHEGHNIDKHPYSKELGQALRDSFAYLSSLPNTHITSWTIGYKERQEALGFKQNADGRLLIHQDINYPKLNFFRALKDSPRRKIFVGPERLKEVVKFLNVDLFIEVPLINSWQTSFFFTPSDNDILIFSAGMPSKVWIAKLLQKNPNITCLDVGSGFDPIFGFHTRSHQLPTEVLKLFYKELL